MARLLFKRAVISATLALLLTGALVSIAFAIDASWNSSCNNGELCNWKDSNFNVPLAATSGGDSDYSQGGDVYPNTSDNINDSVSSMRNLLAANDVVWYHDWNYQGNSYCLDAGWEISSIGSLNDTISSHLIAANNTCP